MQYYPFFFCLCLLSCVADQSSSSIQGQLSFDPSFCIQSELPNSCTSFVSDAHACLLIEYLDNGNTELLEGTWSLADGLKMNDLEKLKIEFGKSFNSALYLVNQDVDCNTQIQYEAISQQQSCQSLSWCKLKLSQQSFVFRENYNVVFFKNDLNTCQIDSSNQGCQKLNCSNQIKDISEESIDCGGNCEDCDNQNRIKQDLGIEMFMAGHSAGAMNENNTGINDAYLMDEGNEWDMLDSSSNQNDMALSTMTIDCDHIDESILSEMELIDSDGDQVIDLCDTDIDNDGVNNENDSHPLTALKCQDLDMDGCDDCAISSMPYPMNDGFDFDSDGQCDSSDVDGDNDGVINQDDSHPYDAKKCQDIDLDRCDDCSIISTPNPMNDGTDFDGDGLCDLGDSDVDNDTRPNTIDPDSFNQNLCGDIDADQCDDCSSTHLNLTQDGQDIDGDGLCDLGDLDDDNDGIADLDERALGDPCDQANQCFNNNCQCYDVDFVGATVCFCDDIRF